MPQVKHDLRVGEKLSFVGSGSTLITLVAKSGQRARLQIVADDSIEITRKEASAPKPSAVQGLGRFNG
jgi:hypothetical protein